MDLSLDLVVLFVKSEHKIVYVITQWNEELQ